MRVIVLLALAVYASAQPAPRFEARDIRPQGAAEPHPLLPGMGVWIFGQDLGPPCGVENVMDPRTYRTELCGVRVFFGGIEAKLLYTSPTQINLIAPDHPWRDELVNVQVAREGAVSAVVPVRFGVNRPVLSLAQPAFTGMPVWVRVEMPWGKGRLRYPQRPQPWELAAGAFEVQFGGTPLRFLPSLPYPPFGGFFMMVGLPGEPRAELLDRAPLHLIYEFDRPGTYEVRYTERDLVSEWTRIEVRPSTAEQRREWFAKLVAAPPRDTVEVLADFLPSLLAVRDEAALRVLARYLDSEDQLLQQYARYALNYFDAALRARVVPGRDPLRGGVM
jgi:hypothetical protein